MLTGSWEQFVLVRRALVNLSFFCRPAISLMGKRILSICLALSLKSNTTPSLCMFFADDEVIHRCIKSGLVLHCFGDVFSHSMAETRQKDNSLVQHKITKLWWTRSLVHPGPLVSVTDSVTWCNGFRSSNTVLKHSPQTKASLNFYDTALICQSHPH